MSDDQSVPHRRGSPWFTDWGSPDASEPPLETLSAPVQSAPASIRGVADAADQGVIATKGRALTTSGRLSNSATATKRITSRPLGLPSFALVVINQSLNRLRHASAGSISYADIGAYVVCFIVTALTYVLFDSHFSANIGSVRAQALCFAAAFTVVFATNSGTIIKTTREISITRKSILITVFVIGTAIALRFLFWRYMPFAQQTGFEELQSGGDARGILFESRLPIEFRFTKILSTLGFMLGGMSLDALRDPFRVTAFISIILLALSLRRLSVSSWVMIFAIYTMATLRWLVIAGGTADELFASIPLVCLIIYCVVGSETSAENRPAWMGIAGIVSGMLAYEYTSYRVIPAMIGVWLLGKAITAKGGSRYGRWLPLVVFISALSIIAAPTFLQTVHEPNNSTFLEAFRRHSEERTAFDSYLIGSLNNTRQYTFGLFGLVSQTSYFYTRPDEPVVPPLIGVIFAASLVIELIKPSRSISRLLGLSVILTILSASFSANNANIGRMTSSLPQLLILSGLFLQRFVTWITSRFSRGAIGVAIGTIVLTFAVVVGNLTSIQLTSGNESVLKEYSNDGYVVCNHIGKVAVAGQTVYLYSIGHTRLCHDNDAAWLFSDGIDLREVDHLLAKNELKPNDVVVIGEVGGLSDSEMARFRELVSSTNSTVSLHMSYDIFRREIAESFCFACTYR